MAVVGYRYATSADQVTALLALWSPAAEITTMWIGGLLDGGAVRPELPLARSSLRCRATTIATESAVEKRTEMNLSRRGLREQIVFWSGIWWGIAASRQAAVLILEGFLLLAGALNG